MKKINFKHSDDSLKKSFKTMHAYDLSLVFPDYDDDEKRRTLELITITKMADLFVELKTKDQLDMLEHLTTNRIKTLFRNIESDDLKAFFEELDEEEQNKMFTYLSSVKQKTIKLLLEYEEDVAASIMSTEYFTVFIDDPIKEATNKVITLSDDNDFIDTIFVINKQKRLLGIIDIKDLIIARGNVSIKEIMDSEFHFVYEDDSIETAILRIKDYDRNAIPVINADHEMLGIITADDVFDELIEDIDHDYQRMALLDNHESTSTAWVRTKQRLPWLLIAVVLNLIIVSFLTVFEATIAQVVALVFFQPLILDSAGNIGTQSLAVTILGFHREEFDHKKMPKRHLLKEAFIGIINSFLAAVTSFILVYGFLSFVPTGNQDPKMVAFVVMISLFFSMAISALMGALVPVLLDRMDIDPAAASGPLMTTINDIVALFIYFGVATLVFL